MRRFRMGGMQFHAKSLEILLVAYCKWISVLRVLHWNQNQKFSIECDTAKSLQFIKRQ